MEFNKPHLFIFLYYFKCLFPCIFVIRKMHYFEKILAGYLNKVIFTNADLIRIVNKELNPSCLFFQTGIGIRNIIYSWLKRNILNFQFA